MVGVVVAYNTAEVAPDQPAFDNNNNNNNNNNMRNLLPLPLEIKTRHE
jgi:hypothetical protein